MLFAILDGIKQEAVPDTKGVCPFCKRNVFSKCGDVYVWHWSHYANESCFHDSFTKPDSFWQEKWKKIFGTEKAEILIQKNGESHIADIISNDIVIMLYDSRMPKKIIREIEFFFGERMFWIVNAQNQGFVIRETELSLLCKDYFNKNYQVVEGNIFDKNTGELVTNEVIHRPMYEDAWLYCTNGANTLVETSRRPIFIDNGDSGFYFIAKDTKKSKRIRLEDFLNKYNK